MVQPLLVSISALTLATETVRSILKIDDVVRLFLLELIKYISDVKNKEDELAKSRGASLTVYMEPLQDLIIIFPHCMLLTTVVFGSFLGCFIVPTEAFIIIFITSEWRK